MPHSRRRGRWFPRAPPAPSSRQRANAAPTGNGNIRRAAATYLCRISPERPAVATFRRGAFPSDRSWQYFAEMHSWALADGKMLAKCVPQRPTVARYRRGAFSGGDPWQLFRFMRSRRGLGREKRQFAATYRRHASKTSWLRQDMRAVHPKSPANGRSGMHRAKILPGGAPFAAWAPQIMHGARILPSFGVWTGKNRAKPNNCRHFDKNTFKSSH